MDGLCNRIRKCGVKPHRKPKNCHYYADNHVNYQVNWQMCRLYRLCAYRARIIHLNYWWIFQFQNIKNQYLTLITLLGLWEIQFFPNLSITHTFSTPRQLSSLPFSSIRWSYSRLAVLHASLAFAVIKIFLWVIFPGVFSPYFSLTFSPQLSVTNSLYSVPLARSLLSLLHSWTLSPKFSTSRFSTLASLLRLHY